VEDLNAMSAFQHTLAPPPHQLTDDLDALQRGADVFVRAGCADCHSGRFFSNNRVIPVSQIGTQPARARALEDIVEVMVDPYVYPTTLLAPPIPGTESIPVPLDAVSGAEENLALAYAMDGEGGYKVITLLGIYLHAPYLHDGGVAAGPDALRLEGNRFVVADTGQLGIAGTLVQNIRPDPIASLRVLIDRQLREPMIEANRNHPDLQDLNIEGIGHEIWVDEQAGFTLAEQNDLILFLLSLDDDPQVLPQAD
jgi:hypothetical protein